MSKKTSKDRSAMIVAVVAIILIIVMGLTAKQRDEITVVEKWVGNVVAPLQKGVSWSATAVVDHLRSILQFSKIRKENEQLNEELKNLQKELIEARLTRDELDELRELKRGLNYVEDESRLQPIAATVIAKNPGNWFNIFTINAGENQGIQKNSIVLAGNGLIGRVYEVGGNWSKVVSIIDNNSSVSFQILRDGSYQGILTGSITGELSGYLFDPLADVVVGDKLITSGLGIYPKGIMIGEVIEVSKSPDQLLKTIQVEPEVNFKRVNKVLIMQ